jgi:type VI protein secretion system component VasK
MWLLKVLVSLPLLVFLVLFLIQNNELVDLWPIPDLKIAVGAVYFVLLCIGYLFGRFDAWRAYSPMRAKLKKQKKENKVLFKEHEKLNQQHEKLNQQFNSLQEAEKKDNVNGFSLNKKIKGWFSKPSIDE